MTVRYVTIPRASELTGYSQDAIRTKIKRGVWLEGLMFIKGPDGRILIDLEAYEQWVTGSADSPLAQLRG
jgi:hypothetical protein